MERLKLKDLIGKLDTTEILFVNGKPYDGDLSKDMLEKEITKINIELEKKTPGDLESLEYSFEVEM